MIREKQKGFLPVASQAVAELHEDPPLPKASKTHNAAPILVLPFGSTHCEQQNPSDLPTSQLCRPQLQFLRADVFSLPEKHPSSSKKYSSEVPRIHGLNDHISLIIL